MPETTPHDDGLPWAMPEATRKRLMAVRRRQFERYSFRLPVTMAWEGGRLETTTRTLALGGLFAACDAPLPSGTRVSLALTLSSAQGREELALAGEVVYATPDGVGVRFLDLDARARARLRAFFLLRDLHCYSTENLPE